MNKFEKALSKQLRFSRKENAKVESSYEAACKQAADSLAGKTLPYNKNATFGGFVMVINKIIGMKYEDAVKVCEANDYVLVIVGNVTSPNPNKLGAGRKCVVNVKDGIVSRIVSC